MSVWRSFKAIRMLIIAYADLLSLILRDQLQFDPKNFPSLPPPPLTEPSEPGNLSSEIYRLVRKKNYT